MDRGGLIDEEPVTAEAAIALTAVGVEDPERRPTSRRAVAVPGDQRLRPLSDDVAPETDPRPASQLQPEARGFGHGSGEATGETRRLQDDQQGLGSPGKRSQPAEPVSDGSRPIRAGEPATGQVQDQQVHRPTGQEHASDGQPFVERLGGDDHQPFEPDAPGNGLDRIEAAGQVHPGHDGARRLGLRGQPEDERGPTAGSVAADRDARRPGQAAGTQDGVERREPGRDDPVTGRGRGRRGRLFRHGRCTGHWGQGEGAFRDPRRRPTLCDPRSCRSPASLEARHGCRHVRGECRHPSKIEHLFYRIKGHRAARATTSRLAAQRSERRYS